MEVICFWKPSSLLSPKLTQTEMPGSKGAIDHSSTLNSFFPLTYVQCGRDISRKPHSNFPITPICLFPQPPPHACPSFTRSVTVSSICLSDRPSKICDFSFPCSFVKTVSFLLLGFVGGGGMFFYRIGRRPWVECRRLRG